VTRRRFFASLIAGAAVVASLLQGAGSGVNAATAPAFVQGANTIGSSIALTKAVTAGDLLVAGITTNDSGTDPVTGVSDNVNGAWTRASSLDYGNGHVDLYYLQNAKAGSVTVTLAGGGGAVTVAEYSGIAAASALDQVTNASGSSSALKAGPTAAIGGAGELVVGVGGQSNAGSGLTAGSGFTLRESAVSNWWAVSGLEDSLSSSTAGQSMAMTSGSSQYFGAVVAVFKAGTPSGAPVAALSLSPASTPVNRQITANASASTPGAHAISTYTFGFGDGTTVGPQAASTATHTYTKGGVFTVTVTVTDTAGVSAAATTQETVGQPVAALSLSPSSGSAPLLVTASAAASSDATGVSISTYSFNFGDGTAAVSGSAATATHTYASTGTFTATVTVTDSTGATSTATAPANVEHGPTAALSLSPTSGQAPLPVTASASGSTPGSNPIASYSFSFGDGSATVSGSSAGATHTYSTGGTYTVTLTVTDSAGLTSTATAQEQVTAAPGTTRAFVQGGGTTSTSLTLSKPVTGGDLLVAGITTGGSQVTGVSDSLNGAWTAASSLAYGNGYVDLYYLQDSRTGTDTVTVAGSAALTVAEYSGVASTAALDQVASGSTTGSTLKAGPTAAIGEAGELVVGVGGQTYAGTGFSAGTGFTLRESAISNWLHAGGLEDMPSGSAAGQSMTLGSGSSGYGGAIVAVFKATSASRGPTAALTLSPTSTPVSQTVTASASGSKAGSNPISTYSFAFGDGTTVGPQAAATATHAYATGGVYTVTVTVTDSAGLTSTATAQETVGQPKAALTVTPSSGNAPLAVTASASASTDAAGIAITGYSFKFGDGSATVSGASSSATHTYTAVGSPTVTVTVTDSTGATATATAPVSVENGPTAALTLSPSSGKAPLVVTANATASTAGSNPISSYKFSFGDGSATVTQSAPTPEPTHTYTAGGTYTVSVTVTDSAGQNSTATAPALIGQPAAALTVTPTSAPLTVTANASASTDPLGISSYTFAFGDGATVGPQGGSTATHAYSSAGTYTVTVTIADSAGAGSTASAKVTVTTPPAAALTVTPTSGIAPLQVTANATASTAGSNPISSYTFSFGDGSASVTQSSATPEPAHTYTTAGTFTVGLTVTDTSGVSSTATTSVVVSPAYVVQDTFLRSNQTGWGTASGGGTWTQESGTASSTSVAGDEGTISNSSSSDFEILGSSTAANDNGLVRFSIGAANDTAGIILGYQSNGTMNLARFGGGGNLEFMTGESGSWTVVDNTSVSVSVNTFYWLRFEVQGSNVYLKLWADGTTEPSSWTWSGTSTATITTAGTMGLYGWASSGSPVEFDSFSVAAVSGSTGPNNSTITGSVTSSAAAPIAGVQVSTVPATTTATTSASGAYSLAVPAATYTVVFTGASVGYNANVVSGVVAPSGGSVSAGVETLAAIPAQEAMDNFTQPAQTGGWSPSTDGSTWNSDLGTTNNGVVITSSQVGVAGAQGFVDTGESTGADYDNWMGYQYANQVVSAQLEITSIVSDPANAHGARLLARVQQLGANDDDTLVEMTVDPYNTSEPAYPNGDISLWVAVNGSWTELAIQGTTISLNTLYDAQVEVAGNVVEGSVWPAGTTQPSWMIEATQTALTSAGQAGTRTTGSNVTWPSFSQVPVTQISGTITSSATGTPITGATVTLTGGATTTTTDQNGDYTFSGLTGGQAYTVTVSATGYTTEAASVSPATGTTATASVALPSASGSCATGGLTTSTQIQSGVTNGPPNDQTETDYTYIDGSGNGWRVGTIPGYGGANLAMWYEVGGCTVGPTQSALDTTSPDDLAHDYTQSTSNNFTGSEDSPYTQVQLPPSIPSFRAGMQATVPSTGVDANGFTHTVTTYVYPGNPGFIVDRFDITNPSSSAILLSPTQPLQLWTISGLEQANSTWAAANGGYGTVGGSSFQGVPTSATAGAPNYFYLDPASGSGVSDGISAALATNLSSLGLANLQIEALVNGNRLKIGVFGDNSVAGQDYSFPAGTTITFYLLQTVTRNLTSAQAESIAADYLNPDTPTMTTGSFDGFSDEQGLYTFTGSGNTVTFTPTFSSTVQERWLDVYAVDGYTSTSLPTVSIGGITLTEGTQYIAAVDTTNHVAYVKLMEPLVPGTPRAGQIQSGPITIG
jgi:PKD repeat protein